jgi:hypothetical protein
MSLDLHFSKAEGASMFRSEELLHCKPPHTISRHPRSKKNVSMETQQHHQHAHAATTQAASKPIDIPGQTHAAATAHAASGPRGLPLGPGPKRLRSGLPTVDSSPAGVGAVRQELLGSPHLAGLSPIAAMALVQTSFVSPPTSPPDDLELEYHQLMWRADQQAGNAPCGTPPHRPPSGPASPCGCNDCITIENGCGEMVCMNCGIVCGRVHVHQ